MVQVDLDYSLEILLSCARLEAKNVRSETALRLVLVLVSPRQPPAFYQKICRVFDRGNAGTFYSHG